MKPRISLLALSITILPLPVSGQWKDGEQLWLEGGIREGIAGPFGPWRMRMSAVVPNGGLHYSLERSIQGGEQEIGLSCYSPAPNLAGDWSSDYGNHKAATAEPLSVIDSADVWVQLDGGEETHHRAYRPLVNADGAVVAVGRIPVFGDILDADTLRVRVNHGAAVTFDLAGLRDAHSAMTYFARCNLIEKEERPEVRVSNDRTSPFSGNSPPMAHQVLQMVPPPSQGDLNLELR